MMRRQGNKYVDETGQIAYFLNGMPLFRTPALTWETHSLLLTREQAGDVRQKFEFIFGREYAHDDATSSEMRVFLVLYEFILNESNLAKFRPLIHHLGKGVDKAFQFAWTEEWWFPDETTESVKQNLFSLAIKLKKEEIARYILMKRPDVWKINMEKTLGDTTPFASAVQNKLFTVATQIASQDDAFPLFDKFRDGKGNTVLHHAVESHHTGFFRTVYERCSRDLDFLRRGDLETPYSLVQKQKFHYAANFFDDCYFY
jgi:hypothetical protein